MLCLLVSSFRSILGCRYVVITRPSHTYDRMGLAEFLIKPPLFEWNPVSLSNLYRPPVSMLPIQ